MELFCSFCFWAHRGFKSSPNSEGFILQSTICKHSVKTTKKPKGLEPCRGFKSFRLFNSVSFFLENPVFAGSDPCGRKKSQNGSVFFRKKAGTKKREKSLEISRFLAVWLAKRLFSSCGSILTTQHGRGRRIRTHDQRFWRPRLYQLSYTPLT